VRPSNRPAHTAGHHPRGGSHHPARVANADQPSLTETGRQDVGSLLSAAGVRGRVSGVRSPAAAGAPLPPSDASTPPRPGGEKFAGKREVRLVALGGVPLVREGDDLCEIILAALARSGETLLSGDTVVLAQKIVSKAQGRYVELASVTPSARALELAKVVEKDPRLIELILGESSEVLRIRRDVVVVVHRLGFVMANAGIDFSNAEANEGDTRVLLLPSDPDGECERLRRELLERTGAHIGIIINDSHGRAWRNGSVGVAIGASGVPALLDLRGKPDLFGRALKITQVGLADELAAAASLLMGQADEGTPMVVVRGVRFEGREGRAADLIRSKELDLFR
jgi:coenzyme F420-0:L-glutamate ligase/coenzyme F420-1:gamma-L-glutamate ligase